MTYEIGTERITYEGPVCSVAVPFDDRTEIVTREVWAHNCYRFDDLTGRTVVDVGANIGATTLAALAHGADRVVAIEPDPENLKQLHRNLEQLDLLGGGWVEAHHAAVGPPGQVQVRRPDGHPRGCCGSSWTTPATPDTPAVGQRPLEVFLDGTDLLVKIDVEGAEYDILAGVDIDVLAARVERLVLEWHHFPDRGVDASERMPPMLLRLLDRYDVEITGPPHLGGLLFATRR